MYKLENYMRAVKTATPRFLTTFIEIPFELYVLLATFYSYLIKAFYKCIFPKMVLKNERTIFLHDVKNNINTKDIRKNNHHMNFNIQ